MKKLTKMQQKVYDYIAQFMTKWGYPPSVREICAELNSSPRPPRIFIS